MVWLVQRHGKHSSKQYKQKKNKKIHYIGLPVMGSPLLMFCWMYYTWLRGRLRGALRGAVVDVIFAIGAPMLS